MILAFKVIKGLVVTFVGKIYLSNDILTIKNTSNKLILHMPSLDFLTSMVKPVPR